MVSDFYVLIRNEIELFSQEKVVNKIIVFVILNFFQRKAHKAASKIFKINSPLFSGVRLEDAGLTFLE